MYYLLEVLLLLLLLCIGIVLLGFCATTGALSPTLLAKLHDLFGCDCIGPVVEIGAGFAISLHVASLFGIVTIPADFQHTFRSFVSAGRTYAELKFVVKCVVFPTLSEAVVQSLLVCSLWIVCRFQAVV